MGRHRALHNHWKRIKIMRLHFLLSFSLAIFYSIVQQFVPFFLFLSAICVTLICNAIRERAHGTIQLDRNSLMRF